MTNDKLREQFEVWLTLDLPSSYISQILLKSKDGEYIYHYSQNAWEVWQACEAQYVHKMAEAENLRNFCRTLQAGEMTVSRAVELLDLWLHNADLDEMLPEMPKDSTLITDDKFPMEVVRELQQQIAELQAVIDDYKSSLVPVAYIHRNEYDEYRLEPVDGLDISTLPFNQDIPLYKAKATKPILAEEVGYNSLVGEDK